MAILGDALREQLTERLAERLQDRVLLRLYTKPGSRRLVLPAGLGCETCEETRALVEELQACAPERIALDVIDVTAESSNGRDVPTLTVAADGADARIAFQGLPGGYEFGSLVDAVERVSRREHGLGERTLEMLQQLTQPVQVSIFTTPT
jgi:alkyl hydroperoxide reductase subunit AhpF